MPTYGYACIECDESVEVNRGITEKELIPPCPKCGYAMSKVFGTPAIQFKGGGYYSTGG